MIVYKTTNLINGKIYIGQDSKNNPNYFGSGTKIKEALREFGINNFSKEILELCETLSELNKKEEYWIEYFDSTNEDIGYNIRSAAVGGHILSLDSINKIKEKRKQQVFTEETLKKFKENATGTNNPFYGKKHTEETCKKISDKLKNRVIDTAWREKLSIACKGRKYTGDVLESIRNKKGKKICQYDLDGNLICEYNSMVEAAEKTLIKKHIIYAHCSGKIRHPKLYIWKYKNNN